MFLGVCMKKKIEEVRIRRPMQKTLSFLLCLGMLLPLSACRKPLKNRNTKTGVKHEEYVEKDTPYFSDTTVEFPLPVDEGRKMDSRYVWQSRFSGDRVYSSYSLQYQNTQEERKELEKLDPSDPQQFSRYYEILDKTIRNGVICYSFQGDVLFELPLEKGAIPASFYLKKDGGIGVFLNVMSRKLNEETNEILFDFSTKLAIYSENGELLQDIVIPISDTGAFDSANIEELDNGNILILNSTERLLLGPDGTIISREELLDRGSRVTSSRKIYSAKGKYYILSSEWDRSDPNYYAELLEEIDPETGKCASPKTIDAAIPTDVYRSGDSYFSIDMERLIKCDALSGKTESVMEYVHTDIAPKNAVKDIKCETDDDIYLLSTELDISAQNGNETLYLTHLHKEEKNPYVGKRIVYAATCVGTPDATFISLINEYNKAPGSKARVVTYVESPSDYLSYSIIEGDTTDQMILSMKSGTGPDVLLNCAAVSQFNSENVLIDLNPYMDGANGIDRTKYFDNIFRAYETNGKLFQLPLVVSLRGLAGNPDLLGKPENWTLSEMDEKLSALSSEVYPISMNSQGLFLELLFSDLDHYVDFSSGKASFDSDDFRSLLEFSKKFGRIEQEKLQELLEQYDLMTSNLPASCFMMQDKVCALTGMLIRDLPSYCAYSELCSHDPLLIGWPSSEGSGFSAYADISAGISAYSKCPEEAWDFLSFLLRSDKKLSFDTDISVSRENTDLRMNEKIDEYAATAKFYGEETWMYDFLVPVTSEKKDAFVGLIEKIRTPSYNNASIRSIIDEEIPFFFDGSKSADEVSKTIQNRVNILLSEQK